MHRPNISIPSLSLLQGNVVLVNGMTEPEIPLSANKWYRFRMVFAAVKQQGHSAPLYAAAAP